MEKKIIFCFAFLFLIVSCSYSQNSFEDSIIKMLESQCSCDGRRCDCQSLGLMNSFYFDCTNNSVSDVADIMRDCTYGYYLDGERWSSDG